MEPQIGTSSNVPVIKEYKKGIYQRFVKRPMDFVLSLIAIVILSPILLIVAILVRTKLGSPVIFKQKRPGLNEKIFTLYKFRTMTDERDENGELLADSVRLTKFGKLLRSTSLDELPELFNILFGDMSIVGPRPQLVRDMVFMTNAQRLRHSVTPGLTGWAQVNGRNGVSWEKKFALDLEYIDNITFLGDSRIIFMTVEKVFKRDGITENDMATAEDLGDYLLRIERITQEEYNEKQNRVRHITSEKMEGKSKVVLGEYEKFSVAISVYKSDNPNFFERALCSITEMQTILPDEIVLVVDGPVSAELNTVIEKYKNKYEIFNVIRLEKNGGLGKALKLAIESAKYDLIARMDSDDVSVYNRFEQQLTYFLNYPKTDIVGGDIAEFIGNESNVVGKRVVPKTDSEIKQYMKKRCAMNHVSVMYRKSAVQAADGYQDWFWNEDYYLWIRMWRNGAVFANTGNVLVNVRVGKEMYQRRGGKKYFDSEKGLQNYMLQNKMIGLFTYIVNITKRFIIQILLPNKLRGWVFRTFGRKKN